MPGLVHVIDDDASFRRAMERRLKHAGYEVADIRFGPALAGSPTERKCPGLHSPRRADPGNGQPNSRRD